MAQIESMSLVARSAAKGAVNWLRSLANAAEQDATPTRQPLPVRQVAAQATGMWLATRIAFLLITVLARAFGVAPAMPTAQGVFSANPQYAAHLLPFLTDHPILANWVHWDASWYLLISMRGYDIFTASTTTWFPMYPLQIHLLTLLLGQDALLPASLLLSNLASLVAFIGLGLLAAQEEWRKEQSESAPARLIMVTAAYPFAFFLFAPFTEGFFLACVVFSLLFARRGAWRWVGVAAFLAGLTRPTAIALAPALAWEYGRQHGIWRSASWRQGAWRSLHWLRTLAGGITVTMAALLGLGSYLLFLQLRYGNALTPYFAEGRYHGHESWPIWQTLAELIRRFFNPTVWSRELALLYIVGGMLILFLVVTLLNIRRLPLFYTLYMLAMLYLVAGTPIPHRVELLPSAGRYLLMSVPVFLLFSRWVYRRPALAMLIIGGGLMLQALFVVFFLNGAWIE